MKACIHGIVFAFVAAGTVSAASAASVTHARTFPGTSAMYGDPLTVSRDILYTFTWPDGHPLEISETDVGAPLESTKFQYKVSGTTTSFKVPADYTGKLWYFCATHRAAMGHPQITINDATAPTSKAVRDFPAAKINYGEPLTVDRETMYTFTWPDGHPLEISEKDLGAPLDSTKFQYKRTDTTTTFTIPNDYTGDIWYFCALHLTGMEHPQIKINKSTTETTAETTETAAATTPSVPRGLLAAVAVGSAVFGVYMYSA